LSGEAGSYSNPSQASAPGERQAQREAIHKSTGAVVRTPEGEVEAIRSFEVSVTIVQAKARRPARVANAYTDLANCQINRGSIFRRSGLGTRGRGHSEREEQERHPQQGERERAECTNHCGTM